MTAPRRRTVIYRRSTSTRSQSCGEASPRCQMFNSRPASFSPRTLLKPSRSSLQPLSCLPFCGVLHLPPRLACFRGGFHFCPCAHCSTPVNNLARASRGGCLRVPGAEVSFQRRRLRFAAICGFFSQVVCFLNRWQAKRCADTVENKSNTKESHGG